MDRRSLLKRAVTVGVVAVAGCLGEDETEFTIQVVETSFGKTTDGRLQLTVTLSNVGNRHMKGTLYVEARLNDDTNTKARDVELPPHTTRDYQIVYDIQYEEVRSFDPSVSVKPLPE
ncbi:MAG: hypothetical protein ABEJ55_06075 [Halanaeroarchaeum sp.]